MSKINVSEFSDGLKELNKPLFPLTPPPPSVRRVKQELRVHPVKLALLDPKGLLESLVLRV